MTFWLDRTPWFTAHVYEINFQPYLRVIRSLSVQEDDELFAPVRAFLAEHPHEVELQAEEDAPTMDSGRAVNTLYRLLTS
ncbi:hypothetical protein [Mycobacteroides abscessus]|uniref:hypothetical protein n=1 Tax=Mycobacteroides abscessus TaxID=36809 RepID=UPI0005E09CDD|nr:hypothetical protein [Mycobacteroides abscessus]CPS38105.1 Uncharacterised protein [Mycobacteroides abscessus]CPS42332.1 Uncharacterised protein [Mycobacteroides abscessus]CPS52305.1 Uncharacterised protein [Mycobacteroides abscessus]CPT33597.1 Uncharacterised protein [Mycobacteroides abscessus]CPT59277.1 Uncharacterised protein [Mycobacteroides abscessus]